MDVEIHDAIRRIHASPAKIALVASGGGIRSMMWLLTTPGASQTVLEALIPYSSQALADFLGERPKRAVTAKTAESMASRAFERAGFLSDSRSGLIGVGCTAAIATDRPKRGDHRVHVSCRMQESLVTYSLKLVRPQRPQRRGHRRKSADPSRPCGRRGRWRRSFSAPDSSGACSYHRFRRSDHAIAGWRHRQRPHRSRRRRP